VDRLIRECGPDADEDGLCPPTVEMLLDCARGLWGDAMPADVRAWFCCAHEVCTCCEGRPEWVNESVVCECDATHDASDSGVTNARYG
jgi:hypothetical protein